MALEAQTHLPHPVLARLPELVGQWRTWLQRPGSSEKPIPEIPAADREALLDLALEVLGECLDQQESGGESAPAASESLPAWRPATADLECPESLSWCVAAFEALLGAAAVTSDTASYFSDTVVPRESALSLSPAGTPRRARTRRSRGPPGARVAALRVRW